MDKIFFNKEIIEKLTNTEKMIVNYAEKNPEKFYNFSIKQLASNVSTSISVISKLTKKLGFKSLKDMQFFIFHNYLNLSKTIKDEKNRTSEILSKLFIQYKESIYQTAHLVDFNKIDLLVLKMIDAEKIFIYGVGSSYLSSYELSINLQKIGINAVSFNDFHSFLLISSQQKDKKTLIILFSKSCQTKEIRFIIDLFEKEKTDFFIITANKMINEKYSNTILYYTIEQSKRFVSISSKINQQFIADILFLLIQSKKINNFDKQYIDNLKILDKWNGK
ncbi:MurR/RpiR family transcriptional regulator [Mesomycoplasma lagogenitalium]|uniref:MurR/RpiR family transcriptional regulator n=1 Tax=Mesomycoplasma lagogenitalium TaxID=171286 RepID=A0ABY8LWM5_9BACT|nr:MurR/RpiR family transcriptional regulator [Mesomycoplasma lagogenitalium]WGI36826.1 MurR/RpiR family transcriptional regulator [Mesomycoplasma lagogenitalium]